MTHLSLFSGIGGLDLAAEMAGFRTVGQCEFADYPTRVLEKHWPGVPRWRDIRTLTKESFYERTGLRTVDVISGGFPCQPFSIAGKRRGKADDRYLWPEMCRVIDELRPSWIVGENVAGLVSMAEPAGKPRVESRAINRLPDADYYETVLSQQERMLLEGILQDLERIGYAVQPFVIPACAVDAPHRRDRLAIVAYCEGKGERGISVQPREARSSDIDADGGSEDVADAESERFQICQRTRTERQPRFEYSGKNVSYHYDWGRYVWWNGELSETQGAGTCRNNHHGGTKEYGGREWWSVEPDVGRVAHGIPSRVDRLKCLGNAVVPAQFYPIFRAIAEVEKGLKV